MMNNSMEFESLFGGTKGHGFNMLFSPRNWMEDYACSLIDGRDFTKRMDDETKKMFAQMQEDGY